MSDPNETPEAKAQRFQDERDEARAQVQTWRNWSDEVVPPWGRTDDRGDDGQRTLISERMTALVRQDGALSERLARVGVERDIAMRERDSVITRLERAERERDEARVQAKLGWERAAEKDRAYGDMIAQRDAAVERAERAERERDEAREGRLCARADCALVERDLWRKSSMEAADRSTRIAKERDLALTQRDAAVAELANVKLWNEGLGAERDGLREDLRTAERQLAEAASAIGQPRVDEAHGDMALAARTLKEQYEAASNGCGEWGARWAFTSAEMDELRRQLAEVRAELTDVREHFAQHRVETPTLVAAKTERETAEAIATWLDAKPRDWRTERDHGVQNAPIESVAKMLAADIRSGAYRNDQARAARGSKGE